MWRCRKGASSLGTACWRTDSGALIDPYRIVDLYRHFVFAADLRCRLRGGGTRPLRYMPIFCLFLVFSLLFKTVPNTHVPWSEAALGGVVTVGIFKVAFSLFAWLSSYFVYDAIYGALAVLPAFLIWLFLVWVILLFGAVFVCSLQQTEEKV